jgi:hypothetical protein
MGRGLKLGIVAMLMHHQVRSTVDIHIREHSRFLEE